MGSNSGIFLGGVSQGFNNTFNALEQRKLQRDVLSQQKKGQEMEQLSKLRDQFNSSNQKQMEALEKTAEGLIKQGLNPIEVPEFRKALEFAVRQYADNINIIGNSLKLATGMPIPQADPSALLAGLSQRFNFDPNKAAAAEGTAAAAGAVAQSNAIASATGQSPEAVQIAQGLRPKPEKGERFKPGSDIGKLIQDREFFASVYGPDSPQAKAFDEMIAGGGKEVKQTDIRGQRQEFTSLSKDFIDTQTAFNKIKTSLDNPSAAGDVTMIFNFMKMLDPQSVVREGEFATAQQAAGVPARIVNLYNRAIEGVRLTPEQRADFATQAENIMKVAKRSQVQLEDQFTGIAERAGFNPEDVVVDFKLPGDGSAPLKKPIKSMSLDEMTELLDRHESGEINLSFEQLQEIIATIEGNRGRGVGASIGAAGGAAIR